MSDTPKPPGPRTEEQDHLLPDAEIRDGFKRCRHCAGWSFCRCATCGKRGTIFSWLVHSPSLWRVGVCTVCHGEGQVPK